MHTCKFHVEIVSVGQKRTVWLTQEVSKELIYRGPWFEDELTSSSCVPKSQHISECQYNNSRLTQVVATHQNCVNDHNEWDSLPSL